MGGGLKGAAMSDQALEELREKLMEKNSWWNQSTPVTVKNWVWGAILGVVILMALIIAIWI